MAFLTVPKQKRKLEFYINLKTLTIKFMDGQKNLRLVIFFCYYIFRKENLLIDFLLKKKRYKISYLHFSMNKYVKNSSQKYFPWLLGFNISAT